MGRDGAAGGDRAAGGAVVSPACRALPLLPAGSPRATRLDGPPGPTAEMAAYRHDQMRAALATPAWLRYLEVAWRPQGYATAPDFQAAILRG